MAFIKLTETTYDVPRTVYINTDYIIKIDEKNLSIKLVDDSWMDIDKKSVKKLLNQIIDHERMTNETVCCKKNRRTKDGH